MPRISQSLQDVKDEDINQGGKWRALPDGEYRFVVTETDYKSTRKGDGMVLWVSVQCIDHAHQRAKWTEFLTIEHPKPDVVRIARAQLKALAIAVGHPTPDYVEFSEDLHDRPFIAEVYQSSASDPKYGDANGMQNRIGAYRPISGGAPAQHAAPRYSESNPPPHTDSDSIPF